MNYFSKPPLQHQSEVHFKSFNSLLSKDSFPQQSITFSQSAFEQVSDPPTLKRQLKSTIIKKTNLATSNSITHPFIHASTTFTNYSLVQSNASFHNFPSSVSYLHSFKNEKLENTKRQKSSINHETSHSKAHESSKRLENTLESASLTKHPHPFNLLFFHSPFNNSPPLIQPSYNSPPYNPSLHSNIPNFFLPANCTLIIVAPPRERIQLKFLDFFLPSLPKNAKNNLKQNDEIFDNGNFENKIVHNKNIQKNNDIYEYNYIESSDKKSTYAKNFRKQIHNIGNPNRNPQNNEIINGAHNDYRNFNDMPRRFEAVFNSILLVDQNSI